MDLDLFALSESIAARKISPVELVRQTLDKIKQDNATYNAFITICEEEAMAAARQAEEEISKGHVKGPLHGIPVAVKDVIFTKGIRTTMGSKVYENHVPETDAAVVEKLKDAGAVIIGKANTHEFAYGPTGDRSLIGPCRNPHNTGKMTGGSSSGSAAALAAGLVSAAIGTDTGGSIRIPASACGIVGMKPTWGLVSTYGVHNTAYTLDHVGPMTRTVKDNAILLNAIVGYDPRDQYSIPQEKEDYTRLIGSSLSGIRIGLPDFFYQHLDPEVAQAMDQVVEAFRKLGATVKEVRMDHIGQIARNQVVTIQAEAYTVHDPLVHERGAEYDPELCERVLAGRNVPISDYIRAQQQRKALIRQFNKVFDDVDVLLTPTLPILPPDIGQREIVFGGEKLHVRVPILRNTAPFNYTGHPALSVPCGFSKDGLPIGFQIAARYGQEALLYQVGYAYENGR